MTNKELISATHEISLTEDFIIYNTYRAFPSDIHVEALRNATVYVMDYVGILVESAFGIN